jgi:hypothetical protein
METDEKEKDQKPNEGLGSKIEFDPEVLDYLHNLLEWEESSRRRNFILVGSRPKCTN